MTRSRTLAGFLGVLLVVAACHGESSSAPASAPSSSSPASAASPTPSSPPAASSSGPAHPQGPPPNQAPSMSRGVIQSPHQRPKGFRFPVAPPPPWPETAGRCPAGMTKVPGRAGSVCIDVYEVHFDGDVGRYDQGAQFPDHSTHGTVRSAAGLEPTIGMSWYQAFAACQESGAHLCTSLEWADACAGPQGRTWPIMAAALQPGMCGYGQGPNTDVAPPEPTGSYPDCRTPDGVYDLLGNVWEWVDPGMRADDGTPVVDKRGAARYSHDPATCSFDALGTHAPDFQGTIGFRCCTAPTR